MARRNKRASMREGPLADLFRSTGADSPEDPPEAPAPGRGPRYGREDPAEARKAEPRRARRSALVGGAFFDQEELGPAHAAPPAPPARQEPPPARREPEPPREPVAREPEPPRPRAGAAGRQEPESAAPTRRSRASPPRSASNGCSPRSRARATRARIPADPALRPRGARLRAARLG